MKTPLSRAPGHRVLISAALALTLAGCASHLRPPAPIENRGPGAKPSATELERQPPGIENAGKPGYYSVRPGDTLIRIGLETGQNWKDIQRWNQLENADRIEVGQVLRVVPPGQDPGQPSSRPVASTRIETRPLEPRPAPTPPRPTRPSAPMSSACCRAPTSGASWPKRQPATPASAPTPTAASPATTPPSSTRASTAVAPPRSGGARASTRRA